MAKWRSWVALGCVLLVSGCVRPSPPAPAELRTGPPPWAAPRDGVSYMDAAGLARLPLNDTADPHILSLEIRIDGRPVPLVANIGMDRVRAYQAPVHTHDDSGQVWLEGQGNRTVTLGQFFTVWGVRFDASCLAAACGGVRVVADGTPVPDPASLVLRNTRLVVVEAGSS